MMSLMFNERFKINSKSSSADQEPFEHTPVEVLQQVAREQLESDEEMDN
jgi:hypothetical protein